MTNAAGSQGRGDVERKDEGADAAPLFPSEGTFSAVVPLSQVRDGSLSKGEALTSATSAAPEESVEAPEEDTLVPGRVSRSTRVRRAPTAGRDGETRRGGRQWLNAAAAVLLSVVAGVAAGTYMVSSLQTRRARPPVTADASASAPTQAAPESPRPQPSQVAAPDAGEVSQPSAEVVRVERLERPETSAAAARKPEPASRRARASAETVDTTPAPKPTRGESAPRRQPTTARTPAAVRTLPVSAPPPSAKSKTVIQWP
jgi:hypothetical protein